MGGPIPNWMTLTPTLNISPPNHSIPNFAPHTLHLLYYFLLGPPLTFTIYHLPFTLDPLLLILHHLLKKMSMMVTVKERVGGLDCSMEKERVKAKLMKGRVISK